MYFLTFDFDLDFEGCIRVRLFVFFLRKFKSPCLSSKVHNRHLFIWTLIFEDLMSVCRLFFSIPRDNSFGFLIAISYRLILWRNIEICYQTRGPKVL